MATRLGSIDKVRASRDGHEFHEAWAARKALQLLLPTDDLVGIAVEGLSAEDNQGAAQESVEIADLTLYHGQGDTFGVAERVVILQFKYSLRAHHVPFRMGDARKTIQKFAKAYSDHKQRFGLGEVTKKMEFQLITNRPISSSLQNAISGIAAGKTLKVEAQRQAKQFKSACGFKGTALVDFAQRVSVSGFAGSLGEKKRELSRILVDWAAASDGVARACLGGMRQLIRDKAGSAGQGANVIRRTDVIDALDLQGIEDLFPCPASFPDIGKIVLREQLSAVTALIPKLDKPLLIHSAGGMGKTVFLQSVSKVLTKEHEVVLFDCFGGGAYRAPEDSRHLPRRGLVHIVNLLAREGLCDPLLPLHSNVEELVKAARRRFGQAVSTLRRGAPETQLLIFLDAIDNAAEHAKDKNEPCFPRLLLESFYYGGRIPGVQLIVSCRTHRRETSRGQIACEELELRPFSDVESRDFLRHRVKDLSVTEEQVAYARSGGNPRILEHLALSDRGLLEPSETKKAIELDGLLKSRIQEALKEATRRGSKDETVKEFLAGLAVLPPPVPLKEYANAYQMDLSAIESFAADLAPLLERTTHGLMFRDEPTETLIRETYSSNVEALRSVAQNLFAKQGSSVYAASALPPLLQKLDDSDLLFKLAFDERFPETITSSVGKQTIRYARLKAAALQAAKNSAYDQLVHLLLELSTIAAVNQRGTEYILQNPDLVVAFKEVDAARRLFETRTSWQGTRHARLAIANALSQQFNDAYRHAVAAAEWIYHHSQQDEAYQREKGGPERQDLAAIALCLITQGRPRRAVSFLQQWKLWYRFEVAEHLFSYLNQARLEAPQRSVRQSDFVRWLGSDISLLAGALSFQELDESEVRRLVRKLARACKAGKPIEVDWRIHWEKQRTIRDGLLKASALGVAVKLRCDALRILRVLSLERPQLWSFNDRLTDNSVFYFLCDAAIRSAAARYPITERTILPADLLELCSSIPLAVEGAEFRKALKDELETRFKAQSQLGEKKRVITYDLKRDATDFIDGYLDSLLELSRAFAAVLSADRHKADNAFLALSSSWSGLRKDRGYYGGGRRGEFFFDHLGQQLAVFALWLRADLKQTSVRGFLSQLKDGARLGAPMVIEVLSILSQRTELHELSGETAVEAKRLIEKEDEVASRASLHARLARAMLPASRDEAASYFRAGLEQMDAVGSGDYELTNELLLFAASLKGGELEEREIHALTNICELNMPDEAEKFGWFAFAKGLSRVSGLRGIAKLGRWDDRSKVSLRVSLLPYLTALIEDDKISPETALGLLRLSDPVELYECGTATFAGAMHNKKYVNAKDLFTELLRQYNENVPGIWSSRTLAALASIADDIFAGDKKQSAYLSLAAHRLGRVSDERNRQSNYHGRQHAELRITPPRKKPGTNHAFRKIVANIVPTDSTSISNALSTLDSLGHGNDFKGRLFTKMRERVSFGDRAKYIEAVARLENLNIYSKLSELAECKKNWRRSSGTLDATYERIGIPLIQIHADDLITYDRLSGYHLAEIAELCNIPMPVIMLELVGIFSRPDTHVSAAVWMALASIACGRARVGEGQVALRRLLNSSAAKLASGVVDGGWKEGLYPRDGEMQIAAGLVWLKLGSPAASDRWQAAHSVRCFGRLGKWAVVDALVSGLQARDAGPFQAPELSFYFLHARLWLLVALARMALDHPADIARYEQALKAVVLDTDMPHVLLRHFAAQTLLTCARTGNTQLLGEELKEIENINLSPFPMLLKNRQEWGHNSFYDSRSKKLPEPQYEFHLDYDFEKYRVHGLSDVFGKTAWEVKDSISTFVRGLDPNVTSMHDRGGRERHSNRFGRMTSEYHFYGEQLGWNGLYLAAGQFLRQYPVTNRSYDDDPWPNWLNGELLTRIDGLWLADGIDATPLDTQINLLEEGETGLVITGNRRKLLSLVGIDSEIPKDLVVDGNWRSADNIHVDISSALASTKHAGVLARQLAAEEPFRVWLPSRREGDDEYEPSKKQNCESWVVSPSSETRLDGDDPLGASCAVTRPYFIQEVRQLWDLKAGDAFNRAWCTPGGKRVAFSEAWGRHSRQDDDGTSASKRLICSSEFLGRLLAKKQAELLLLIRLQRYEKGLGNESSRFSHTTAVLRIKQTLSFRFYGGAINLLHKDRF
jgi:hypothetical protein